MKTVITFCHFLGVDVFKTFSSYLIKIKIIGVEAEGKIIILDFKRCVEVWMYSKNQSKITV